MRVISIFIKYTIWYYTLKDTQEKSLNLIDQSQLDLENSLKMCIGFAHDIKNLMSCIKDGLDTVKEFKSMTSDVLIRYQSAKESRRLILNYLHNIISYANQSEDLNENQIYDLRSIIHNCFMTFRFKALLKKVNMSYVIDENLPRIYINTVSMRQILINLLDNAIKYTFNGSVSLIVRWKPSHILNTIPLKFRCSAPNQFIMNSSLEDLETCQAGSVGSYDDETQEPDYSGNSMDTFNYHGETDGKLTIKIENIGENSINLRKGTGIGHMIISRLIKNLGGKIKPLNKNNSSFSIKITLSIKAAHASEQDVDSMQDKEVIIIGDIPTEIKTELVDIGCRITNVSTSEEINNIDEHSVTIASDTVLKFDNEFRNLPGLKILFHPKDDLSTISRSIGQRPLRNQLSDMLKGQIKKLGSLFESYEATETVQEYVGKLSVVVIDDEPFQAQIVTKMLESKYEVHTFIDPLQAEEYIRNNHIKINAVLVDLNMPLLDGFSLCRAIRNFEKKHKLENLPVISMSGDETSKMKLIQASFTSGLTKPFSRKLLMSELERVTRNRS